MSKALRLQGGYYLAGGLWPLVSFRSFEVVTGPKPDRFVTEVTSALYAAIGMTLLAGSRQPPVQVRILAVLSALASAGMDLRHRPDVRRIYLGEAALEVLLIAGVLRDWYDASAQHTA